MIHPDPLAKSHPGGCYLGFNSVIDRKPAEQLVWLVSDAHKNGFKSVNLLLSSTGGMLDQTHYLCNLLDAMPLEIVTYNVGNIMSAANLLFLCGDRRYAVEGAVFFFHQSSYPPPGDQITSTFAKSRAQSIDRDDTRTANFVAAKIRRPAEEVLGWQRSEMFMDTGAALACGIIEGVKAPVIPHDAFFHQVVV